MIDWAYTPNTLGIADVASKSVNNMKPDAKGNTQLGSVANTESIESKATSVEG